MLLSVFPSVAAVQTENSEKKMFILNIIKHFKETKTKDIETTDWFPGFIIVQIIKGIIAFIVVLLILFDLIDPEEELI